MQPCLFSQRFLSKLFRNSRPSDVSADHRELPVFSLCFWHASLGRNPSSVDHAPLGRNLALVLLSSESRHLMLLLVPTQDTWDSALDTP